MSDDDRTFVRPAGATPTGATPLDEDDSTRIVPVGAPIGASPSPAPQASPRTDPRTPSLISFGSGDPTRAICSTMIAQAFESIRYPVLPYTETQAAPTFECPGCVDEVYRIRDHSLYAPRDFDVSPYFRLVKPSLEADFDFHTMIWRDAG